MKLTTIVWISIRLHKHYISVTEIFKLQFNSKKEDYDAADVIFFTTIYTTYKSFKNVDKIEFILIANK